MRLSHHNLAERVERALSPTRTIVLHEENMVLRFLSHKSKSNVSAGVQHLHLRPDDRAGPTLLMNVQHLVFNLLSQSNSSWPKNRKGIIGSVSSKTPSILISPSGWIQV